MAKTSAEADMFTRKSVQAQNHQQCIPIDTLYVSSAPFIHPPGHRQRLEAAFQLRSPRTLHSGLGSRSRESSHGADHEVLENEVAAGALAAPILAEVWDLGRRAVAHALEGRVERRGFAPAGGSGREQSARRQRQRRARHGTQQGARGGREGGHCCGRGVRCGTIGGR